MAITVTATLIGTETPKPVQVVVAGLTVGPAVTVTASWSGGASVVRGADGLVATSTQLVLADVMVPINVPVTYTAVQGASSGASGAITVPWPERYVLHALDGSGAVTFMGEHSGDPRGVGIRSSAYYVAGRVTPVTRFDATTTDTGSWMVITQGDATTALRDLLADGAPIVLRTDGTVSDLPAVAVVQTLGASNALLTGVLTDRRWSLAWAEVDDPDADDVLTLATFEDFDTVYAGLTFAAFDAEWAGQTFADFDVEDWRGRSGL